MLSVEIVIILLGQGRLVVVSVIEAVSLTNCPKHQSFWENKNAPPFGKPMSAELVLSVKIVINMLGQGCLIVVSVIEAVVFDELPQTVKFHKETAPFLENL